MSDEGRDKLLEIYNEIYKEQIKLVKARSSQENQLNEVEKLNKLLDQLLSIMQRFGIDNRKIMIAQCRLIDCKLMLETSIHRNYFYWAEIVWTMDSIDNLPNNLSG